ncbi:hypothetical protein M3Y94_00690400 [Aphelenchoides besseyi]|nr:hypothetical protein M3Y94_00690400 [Aphelenchoides besseyi]KAI6231519.1 Acyl-coenzyme A thioesterase 9, mitochondrial [Aphelenchoides besseyi]
MLVRTVARFSSFVHSPRTIIDVRETLERHVAAMKSQKIIQWQPDQTVGSTAASKSRALCVIPLGSQPEIRDEYLNHRETTRFGKILEDLDTFAVYTAYKHNQMGQPLGEPTHHQMLIVTAAVDRIDVQNTKIRSNEDIEMHGRVTWVGRSSLESTMILKQKNEHGHKQEILTAKFVMASRSTTGNSAVPNLRIETQSADEIERFEQGKHAHLVRRDRESHSLLRELPTEIERTLMHDLFLRTLDPNNQTRRDPPNGCVWMQDAQLRNCVLCYPIERNLYGKIFGGYLMRIAMETAWGNAAIFSKSRPKLMAVGHIKFEKSVEVGAILLFHSQVSYSTDRFMQVSVEAQVLDVEKQTCELTNTFQFTFKAESTVPFVMPKSYADGIVYLNGRRHFNRSAHEKVYSNHSFFA